MQMFLLPFAGGNSLSFKKFLPLIDKRVEMFTVEYSGRLNRADEGFINDHNEFLNDVAEQINNQRNIKIPYALFGYSLGSMLAYELLSKNIIEGKSLHVFICAKGSPFYTPADYGNVDYESDDFTKEIFDLGGVDSRILSDKRFLEAYMRPIRADYVIWGQYRYKGGRIPCNATAIYSEFDIAATGVKDWSLVVDKDIDFFDLGRNHFFINEHLNDVADIVNSHLNFYLA